MKSPYEILGVSEYASDDEIKAAYKALALKYSSDNYSGNPLGDMAHRKMQEIDNAYDEIIMIRRGGRSNGQGNAYTKSSYHGYGENSYTGYGSSRYGDVRSHIQSGRIEDAQTILDGIPPDMRDAEWHYLKGNIFHNRGWFEEATKSYAKACDMEPNNEEYRSAYDRIRKNRNGGYRTEESKNRSGCSSCDLCSGLICADCCCECFGGDLIPCC